MSEADHLDTKIFQQANSAECTHTIGVYKSGRCRACGFKLFENLNHRAHKLGLTGLVKNKGHKPESNWGI